MRLSQRRVIKLNLHVDDVRHSRPRHLGHVLGRPNPASDRNAPGQPCHVHYESPVQTLASCVKMPPQIASISQSLRPMPISHGRTLSNLRPLTCFHFTVSLSNRAAPATPSPVTSVLFSRIFNLSNRIFASESASSSAPPSEFITGHNPTISNKYFIAR